MESNVKTQHLLVAMVFIVYLLPTVSRAQCCAAGNPLNFSPDLSRSEKESITASVLYRNSYSDTYYNGREVIDIDYVDHSGFNYMEAGIEYGISQRASVKVEAGYFLTKYETYKNPDFADKVATGLADLNLEGRFEVYKKPSQRLRLQAMAGLKLPIGVFDLEEDQVKFPVQLQPSSGSFRYHGGLLVSKGFVNSKLNAFATANIEISQRIKSKNFDYKYGTVYVVALGAAWPLTTKVTLMLQARTEIRRHSSREENQQVEASGGRIVMLVPQISMQPFKDWHINLSFSAPVYRNYHSIQLGNKYSFSVSLSKSHISIKRKAVH